MNDRAGRHTTPDGRQFENLTELVVDLLSKQTETETHSLRSRARVRGRSTTHEIDVWWEPVVGGVRRRIAFQCKDLARPVDQGEMLKFRAVLDDLNGKTSGVFVARGGYQRGAIMVAAMSNILRLEIDRTGDDETLLIDHVEILEAEIKLRRDDEKPADATGEDDLYGDEVVFYDAQGRVRGNLLQMGLVMLERFATGSDPVVRTRRFREPMFIRDGSGGLHQVSSLTVKGRLLSDSPVARMIIELLDLREE